MKRAKLWGVFLMAFTALNVNAQQSWTADNGTMVRLRIPCFMMSSAIQMLSVLVMTIIWLAQRCILFLVW